MKNFIVRFRKHAYVKFTVAVSLSTLLLCASVVSAEDVTRAKPTELPKLTGTNLSDAQRKELNMLMDDYYRAESEGKAKIKALDEQINLELNASSPDRSRLEGLVDDLFATRKSQYLTQIDIQLKLSQLLTLEQREKIGKIAGRKINQDIRNELAK